MTKTKQMQLTINVRGKLLSLAQPIVMGVLNCTPDSFYAESRVQGDEAIARRARQIVDEGARIIDVGGCSTRPGGDTCDEPTEMERVRQALKVVRQQLPDAVVSVDTFRPNVARMAVEEFDADIINDVSEGGITGIVGKEIHEEGDMFETVAQLGVPYILMSVQPTLAKMMQNFAAEVQRLRDLGAKDIILDPGYGFGKTLEQNYEIMSEAERLLALELPVLVGVSRKSMIYRLVGGDPTMALNGTTVLHTVSLQKGASILRVHDVKEAFETIRIVQQLG